MSSKYNRSTREENLFSECIISIRSPRAARDRERIVDQIEKFCEVNNLPSMQEELCEILEHSNEQ